VESNLGNTQPDVRAERRKKKKKKKKKVIDHDYGESRVKIKNEATMKMDKNKLKSNSG
jgi:hypothetical protein